MLKKLCALALAIICASVVLAACSKQPSVTYSVEVDGETMSLADFRAKVLDDELAARKQMQGKVITVTAPVSSVEGAGDLSVHFNEGATRQLSALGTVKLSADNVTFDIEVTDSTKGVAASLSKGDAVKATGILNGLYENGQITEAQITTYNGARAPEIEKAK